MAPPGTTRVDGAPPPAVTGDFNSLIGTTIDRRYKLREILGEGGMGAVFIATHLKLRKDVAVKIIRPQVADNDTIAERFRREARTTAQIDNPHVVHAIDFGKLADGSDYFVLQLVQGRPLSDVMAVEGAKPWVWACEVCSQIADALAAVHEAGVVHRDLKPDNIILTERDDGKPHVYVLDFGIARIDGGGVKVVSGPDSGPLTRAGAVLGTPGYMSPQQISGDTVDHSADIYALGVILWECVAGRRLWAADSLAEMFARQLREEPPSLDAPEFPRDIPAGLVETIERMLSRSVEGRPARAEDVRHTLVGLVASTRSPSMITDLSLRAQQPAHEALETMPDRSSASRSKAASQRDPAATRKLLLMLGVPLALLLAVVMIRGLAGDDDAPAEKKAAADAPSKTETPAPKAETKVAAPVKATPVNDDDVPEELQSAYNTIAKNRSDGRRKKAAKTVLKYEPRDAVPAFIRLAAELQMAERCEDKKAVVEQLAALGDPRGVEAVRRYEPRGFHACGRRDCYGCMRQTMADAIRKMGAEPSERTLQAIGEIE